MIKTGVPIAEVARVVGDRQVAIALDIQLIKLVGSLNLKWNITDGQIQTIVEDIMDKYPNESIEDFVLCFKKARMGEFGELYRLDSAVVFVWIQRYLDEKYEVLENELRKAKQNDYHVMPEVTDGPGRRLFDEWANKMTMGTKIPDMPEDEIKRTGQEDPPKKKAISYPSSSPEVGRLLDLKSEYGRKYTDPFTGKPLPGAPTFNEFIRDL